MEDASVVAWQLGRPPRGRWRVASRCSYGYPTCIATAPATEAGEPFPTLFYVTCPHLVEAVARLESDGLAAAIRVRLAEDATLAPRLLDADERYRKARAAEGGGVDPAPEVGIAGQRDPLAVKCLHAHVGAHRGGIVDPVGEMVLGETDAECGDRRCEEAG
jgi:hypothetical protein